MEKYEAIGLKLPEVEPGDDLAELIVEAAERAGVELEEGDVLVVTSKIVSKARGYLLKIDEIRPGLAARLLSKLLKKPDWEIELISEISKRVLFAVPLYELAEKYKYFEKVSRDPERARRVVRGDPVFLVVEMPSGRMASDAGIDTSNVPPGYVCFPPLDPDLEAKRLRDRIREISGVDVGVVVADTEGMVSRAGSIDIAVGCSGIQPVSKKLGEVDRYGKPKFGGVDLVADELAAAAALLMGQTSESVPVVLFKGLEIPRGETPIREVLVSRRIVVEALLKGLVYTLLTRILLSFRKLLG